jgi:hypothetical protein
MITNAHLGLNGSKPTCVIHQGPTDERTLRENKPESRSCLQNPIPQFLLPIVAHAHTKREKRAIDGGAAHGSVRRRACVFPGGLARRHRACSWRCPLVTLGHTQRRPPTSSDSEAFFSEHLIDDDGKSHMTAPYGWSWATTSPSGGWRR